MSIKALLFDLGGVIIDIDPLNTIKEFQKKSSKPSGSFEGLDYRYSKNDSELMSFFYEYEKGLVSENEFREGMRKLGKINLNDSKIDKIWNLGIVKINEELLNYIVSLNERYSIMILSNTNSIHRKHFDALVNNLYGKNFNQIFNRVYYSYELGLRKPEKEIYEFVVKDSGFLSNEILFFDDIKENIESCENVGMKGYKVNNILDMMYYLKNLFK